MTNTTRYNDVNNRIFCLVGVVVSDNVCSTLLRVYFAYERIELHLVRYG